MTRMTEDFDPSVSPGQQPMGEQTRRPLRDALVSIVHYSPWSCGPGLVLSLVIIVWALVAGGDLRWALPAGMSTIGVGCLVLALLFWLLFLPFAVHTDRRFDRILRTAEARNHYRAVNAATVGMAATPALFFLAFTVPLYLMHLLLGGDWNLWRAM